MPKKNKVLSQMLMKLLLFKHRSKPKELPSKLPEKKPSELLRKKLLLLRLNKRDWMLRKLPPPKLLLLPRGSKSKLML